MSAMSPIVVSSTDVGLNAAPIEPSWVLEGAPRARCQTLAVSKDRTARTVVWDCTPGRFNWHYASDETIHLIEGEVTITDQQGTRQVRAGDMVFFPAGSRAEWHVQSPVRKIAFLRTPLPKPVGFCVRAWSRFFAKGGGL